MKECQLASVIVATSSSIATIPKASISTTSIIVMTSLLVQASFVIQLIVVEEPFKQLEVIVSF